MSEVKNRDEKKYTSWVNGMCGWPGMSQNDSNWTKNAPKPMKILSNPMKISKCSEVAEYQQWVFGVREKQHSIY